MYATSQWLVTSRTSSRSRNRSARPLLASRQGEDIPIKHLYVEYRHWVEREKPFPTVEHELATLARQGDDFRRILEPTEDDPIRGLVGFLEAFDIRTASPLLLALLDAKAQDETWIEIARVLESYLLRRAVCNLGTKNYNRIFLTLTKIVRRDGFGAAALVKQLFAQTGESGEWPDDGKFREAWVLKPLYGPLNSPKLVHLFGRLNQAFMSSKSEAVTFAEAPTVEHILPQNWETNWPLPEGLKTLDGMELVTIADDDPRAVATRKREAALQTLGNLTILSTGLNSAQSNLPWHEKRPEMMKHSLLPLNQSLFDVEEWNENAIKTRGEDLFAKALAIWPRAQIAQ